MEFNPYSDSFFDDPYETYRWMRDEAPVYYSERWDFYALTRYEDVVAAHRDWETFSSAYGVTLDALSMRQRFNTNMLIIMDPPEHERLRKLVRQVFTKAAIANLEPLVAEVVTSYIDALKDGRTSTSWPTSRPCSRSKSSPQCSASHPENDSRSGCGPTDSCTGRRTTRSPRKVVWRTRWRWAITSWSWPARSAATPTT